MGPERKQVLECNSLAVSTLEALKPRLRSTVTQGDFIVSSR